MLGCYTYAVNCGYCTRTRTRTRTCTRSYCTRNIPGQWCINFQFAACFGYRRAEYRSSDLRHAAAAGKDQSHHDNDGTGPGDVVVDDAMTAVRSKLERIHQLRRQYQQTHRERQGRYLHDDQEDLYEQQIKHYEQVCVWRRWLNCGGDVLLQKISVSQTYSTAVRIFLW